MTVTTTKQKTNLTQYLKGKELKKINQFIKKGKKNFPILQYLIVKNNRMYAWYDLDLLYTQKTTANDGVYNPITLMENTKYSINDSPVPNIKEAEKVKTLAVINKKFFIDTLKKAKHAVSKNDIRGVLTGVNFTIENKTLTAAATDSYRLYVRTTKNEKFSTTSNEKKEFTIRKPKKILKMLPFFSERIEVLESDLYIILKGKTQTLYIRKFEQEYPNHLSVLERTKIKYKDLEVKPVIVDLKDFRGKLKKIKNFYTHLKQTEGIEPDYQSVTLTYNEKDNRLELTVNTDKDNTPTFSISAASKKTADYNNDQTEKVLIMPIRNIKEKTFNVNYLLQALTNHKQNTLTLQFTLNHPLTLTFNS